MERYYTIEEVLSGYYEREFSRIEENENPHFSLVHKYRMKKIFGIFRKNSEKADKPTTNKNVKRTKSL